jgi:hypothetical protein
VGLSRARQVLVCLGQSASAGLVAEVNSPLAARPGAKKGEALEVSSSIALLSSRAAARKDLTALASAGAPKCLVKVFLAAVHPTLAGHVQSATLKIHPVSKPHFGDKAAAYHGALMVSAGGKKEALGTLRLDFVSTGQALVSVVGIGIGAGGLEFPSALLRFIAAKIQHRASTLQ